MPDRMQFAAKTKRVDGEVKAVVPAHTLEKLGIAKGTKLVFEACK